MSNTKYFDIEEGKYIVEYSDRDKSFHFNFGYNIPNSNTYHTIMEDVTIDQFNEFIKTLPKNNGLSVEYLLSKVSEFRNQ
jgi:hypothetical protein